MSETETLQEMLGEPERRQGERDAKWRSIRNEHLRTHSFCIACGNTDSLEVHHIKPFVQNPELELDPDNLVTLCTCSSRGKMNCHLIMGHNGSMSEYNPNVVHDSVMMLKRINRGVYNGIVERFRAEATDSIRWDSAYVSSPEHDEKRMWSKVAERLIESGMPFKLSDEIKNLAANAARHIVLYNDIARSLASELDRETALKLNQTEMGDMLVLLMADKNIASRITRSCGSEKTGTERSRASDVKDAIYRMRAPSLNRLRKEMDYSLIRLRPPIDPEDIAF